MHSEIVPPQGRLRASIAIGLVFVSLCFVVAALEHTIERLTDEATALRAELARYKDKAAPADPSCGMCGTITSSGTLTLGTGVAVAPAHWDRTWTVGESHGGALGGLLRSALDAPPARYQ